MAEDPDLSLARDSRLDDISRQFDELFNHYKRARAKLLAKVEAETSYEMETKDLVPTQITFKNPKTGEKVVMKDITQYDVLEVNLKLERQDNNRLLQRLSQLKSENEVLHRKVNDLGHKLCKARRERDQLAEKLRKSEGEAHFYRSLVLEKLAQLIKEER